MQHQKKTTRAVTATPARLLSSLLVVGGVLALGAGAARGHAPTAPTFDGHRSTDARDQTSLLVADILEDMLDTALDETTIQAATAGEELTLETLKFFIEFNETDEDIGVQCLLGGEPYRLLRAYNPDRRRILDLRPRRALRQQGLSDFFFESAEPTLDEFALTDFLERFPAGTYEFQTKTIDGPRQDGATILTHAIPAGPVITFPLDGDTGVDRDSLVITWEPVTLTTAFTPPQVPVTIIGYQVIVTRDEPLRVYSVDLPADATSVSVPPEFLEPGTEYELEILAVEASDNQTISIIFFETE